MLISATIWICLRSDWLLPIEVREEVQQECLSVASRTPRPGASPNLLRPPSQTASPYGDVRSPPSARTHPVKSPSPANSPLSPVPNLEVIEEGHSGHDGHDAGRKKRSIHHRTSQNACFELGPCSPKTQFRVDFGVQQLQACALQGQSFRATCRVLRF